MIVYFVKEMADTPDPEIEFRQPAPVLGQGDGRDNLEPEFDGEEAMRRQGPDYNRGDYDRPAGNNRHYIKPEPYSGNSDWEEYFSHFEDCVELGGLDDNEKVLTLAACLRGPARTFYISLSHAERRNYEVLVNKLQQRFGCTRQQNRWLSRFESRKRYAGESIALLGDDLRQLSQKAFSNLDSRAQEALALNQLYKSISLEMKCRCIDKECDTVSDAIQVIERYEGILGVDSQEKKKAPVRHMSEYHNSSDPALEQLTARIMKLEETSKQPSQQTVPQSPNTGFAENGRPRSCFVCNDPGHFYRNCPIYQKCTKLSSRSYQRQQSGTGNSYKKPQENFKPSM